MFVYIYCVYIILQHNKTLKSAVVKHLLLQGTILSQTYSAACHMPYVIKFLLYPQHKLPLQQ